MDLMDKALRIGEGKRLRDLQAKANQVIALDADYTALTDAELKEKTEMFKRQLDAGDSIDSILIPAFAAIREAAWRILNMKPFPVQIMGGIALHQGCISEMATGEGKTLVTIMPAYLNALTGKGVHVITVNDYLAKYAADQMGRVFRFMGLSTGCILTEQSPVERKRQYDCDITYGTNNEFGFDYLRDNMTESIDGIVQRGHNYAIVDEVDSILIDEARTPLIISGPAENDDSKWFKPMAAFVRTLKRDDDYTVDEKKKTVCMLDSGVRKLNEYIGVDNAYENGNAELIGCMMNALKAKELFQRDRDYVVKKGEVLIVDEHTGRILPGRRYNDGLHQAIEAKEKVEIQPENQTYATVTLQNYFRLYDKLAGMTGTAETEAAEFMNTYKLPVIPIPSNKPCVRVDHDDMIYLHKNDKLKAIIADVAEHHKTGQPVLIGTASVESSEEISALLDVAGIEHTVLNAKNNKQEAGIVAMAGCKGAVTVATNMAGRGTDIMLGGNVEYMTDETLREQGLTPSGTPAAYDAAFPDALKTMKAKVKAAHDEIIELGGLYVIGSERHEARRIDNQLRGRAGRQGDPGESRFYVSLEDDLMRLFNTRTVAAVMNTMIPTGDALTSKRITKGVRTAQKNRENMNYEQRKDTLKYDDVLNKQRRIVYAERNLILHGADVNADFNDCVHDVIHRIIMNHAHEQSADSMKQGKLKPLDAWDYIGIIHDVIDMIPDVKLTVDSLRAMIHDVKSRNAVNMMTDCITSLALDALESYHEKTGDDRFDSMMRSAFMEAVDGKWREHLYEMDYLKISVGLRGYAQREPVVEYQNDGYRSFNNMKTRIQHDVVKRVFNESMNA